MAKMKTDESIELIRKGLLRQELIDFIKREDSHYSEESFDGYSDELLYTIATFVETRAKVNRQEMASMTNVSACNKCIDGEYPCLKYSKDKKGKLICYTPAHPETEIRNANKKDS
jgi:hypothetical protein